MNYNNRFTWYSCKPILIKNRNNEKNNNYFLINYRKFEC